MVFVRGQLIAFSGIDGAGKSTQIQLLGEELKRCGKRPVYLWTRGGYTGLFNVLKGCLRLVLARRVPPSGHNEGRARAFKKPLIRTLWLSIAILDLMLVYGIYVRVSGILGRFIIADRYLWDTWIDFRLNFPEVKVDRWILWRILKWVTPEPDVSFLMLIPVEESLRRSKQKNEPFPDSENVLRQRLELYTELSGQHKFNTIDCLQAIEVVQNEIVIEVEKVRRAEGKKIRG